MSTDEIPGIDPVRVGAWLDANVADSAGPYRFDLIAGGRSNLTFRVTAGDGTTFVLRRPPLGHVLATAHDMGREFRIISALQDSGVPVAPALGMCADDAVNGAPFYVMGYVEGKVLDSPSAGASISMEARATASQELIDVLVRLHSIDPASVGLGELGKRDGYLGRQLRRWSTQWANSKTRELPIVDEVHRRLEANQPAQSTSGIVHGDYRLGNCLTDPSSGHLRAVLDWELCTLGDVLADVGYLLVYWSDPTGPQLAENDPSGQPGYPSRAEMVERYARATGRDVAEIRYYEAFSCWRLACIAEGVRARYQAGVMGDDGGYAVTAEDRVALLAQRSIDLLDAIAR